MLALNQLLAHALGLLAAVVVQVLLQLVRRWVGTNTLVNSQVRAAVVACCMQHAIKAGLPRRLCKPPPSQSTHLEREQAVGVAEGVDVARLGDLHKVLAGAACTAGSGATGQMQVRRTSKSGAA